MKFVQIAVATDGENGLALYALGNDGNIYELSSAHYGAGGTYQGRAICRGNAYTGQFWKKIDLPFTEPELSAIQLQRLEFQDDQSEA